MSLTNPAEGDKPFGSSGNNSKAIHNAWIFGSAQRSAGGALRCALNGMVQLVEGCSARIQS